MLHPKVTISIWIIKIVSVQLSCLASFHKGKEKSYISVDKGISSHYLRVKKKKREGKWNPKTSFVVSHGMVKLQNVGSQPN